MFFFTAGTWVLVDCNVTGNPQPTIKWYKLEVNQDEVRSYRVPQYYFYNRMGQNENGTLEFSWIVETWDVGIYTCVATNKYGSDVMHKYVCVGSEWSPIDTSMYYITVLLNSDSCDDYLQQTPWINIKQTINYRKISDIQAYAIMNFLETYSTVTQLYHATLSLSNTNYYGLQGIMDLLSFCCY